MSPELDERYLNRGRVRLVGVHDLGPELKAAYLLSRERVEELLREMGGRIASGLESFEDIFAEA